MDLKLQKLAEKALAEGVSRYRRSCRGRCSAWMPKMAMCWRLSAG
jgi:hypothetical protein